MKTNIDQFLFLRPVHWWYALIAVAMLLLSGCATQMSTADEEPIKPIQKNTIEFNKNTPIPVVRYGRYTLVEVENIANRQDVFQQIIDVKIPVVAQKDPSVADGMRYLLINSGYQLCESEDIKVFEQFQLPLTHQRMGPITLKDALLVLVGSGWQMQIDHFSRHVCFMPEIKAQQTNLPIDAATLLKENLE